MDIKVRQLTKKDYNDLRKSMQEAYDCKEVETWSRKNIIGNKSANQHHIVLVLHRLYCA